MTKKDFELIAEVVRRLQKTIPRGAHSLVIYVFSEALLATNARFDRKRFEEACTEGKLTRPSRATTARNR